MRLSIPQASQVLVHGTKDDIVPPAFSRNYVEKKKKAGENVTLLEITQADHFDLIDPRSTAWPGIEKTILSSLRPADSATQPSR